MKVVIDDAGKGFLQLPMGNLIGFCNNRIDYCLDGDHPVKETTFPVRLFIQHLLAGTTQYPYDKDVLKLLLKEWPAYLMPRYLSEEDVQVLLTPFLAEAASPEAVKVFLSFWAQPKEYLKMNQVATTEVKEKKVRAPKVAKEPGEKKARGSGIGAFCKTLIQEGKTNKEILEAVAEKFPGAKTTAGCVAYYRNALKVAAAKVN